MMKYLRMLVATVLTTLSLLATTGQPVQLVQATDFVVAACSPATWQGRYEFLAPPTITVAPGTVIAIPEELLYASPVPAASKGTLIFDETGGVSLNGVETVQTPLASPVSYSGVYTMDADCSATATFSNGTQLSLKMVGGGEAWALVSITPGFVILRPPAIFDL